MKHGSLFSGIGGFDLAAHWMNWENVFHCEWNSFGQKILKYYWPNAELFEDIKKSNFKKYENKIDIISGGFPCQPYSSAGKRKGKNDDRHLWPEMLRAIREIKPRWIVGENVSGLINWSKGLVFHEVQTDLEIEGYEVQPVLLPAAAVGAPHRRDRIFFIAYANGNGYGTKKYRKIQSENGKIKNEGAQTLYNAPGSNGNKRTTTNTNSNGLYQCNIENEVITDKRRINAFNDINQVFNDTQSIRSYNKIQNEKLEGNRFAISNERNFWDTFPTQPPICFGNDGISNKLDGITISKWRKETLMAAGNAVVPQLILQIFKTIEQYEKIYNVD